MIITYTMIAVWGVLCLGLMYKICRTAIVHEMSRRHDKKLRAENIHIIRGKLRNIILAGFVALIFPVAMFLTHLLGDMGFHLFYDIAAFCAMCMAICFFYGPVEDYTEISPEGIERGESRSSTRSTQSVQSHTVRPLIVTSQTALLLKQNQARQLRISAPAMMVTTSSQ